MAVVVRRRRGMPPMASSPIVGARNPGVFSTASPQEVGFQHAARYVPDPLGNSLVYAVRRWGRKAANGPRSYFFKDPRSVDGTFPPDYRDPGTDAIRLTPVSQQHYVSAGIVESNAPVLRKLRHCRKEANIRNESAINAAQNRKGTSNAPRTRH